MKNPFSSESESFHSYVNLKERIFQLIRQGKVYDQIFQVVQSAYEDALGEENILLSRPERARLLSQVLRLMLEDMIKKLDERSGAA
jgi:hypothetical protein